MIYSDMKYSMDWLTTQIAVDYLFFWGHQPDKAGTILKTCLSQWWLSDFKEDDILYRNAEQYMMARKAKLFNDPEIAEKIQAEVSPKEVKALGKQIKNFDGTVWDVHKYEIVKRGNYLKFSQNKPLQQFLVQTGNKVLVEASPVDAIWGIGMAENHVNAKNPSAWRGENLLGFALMEVRDELNKI